MISARASAKVDAFMAVLDHPRKAEIERFREVILNADPALGEQIKWNAPSYGYKGDDRVTFRIAPPPALQLVFHRGAKAKTDPDFRFEDPAGHIIWAAPDRGVVTLSKTTEPEAVADLVRRWMKATG